MAPKTLPEYVHWVMSEDPGLSGVPAQVKAQLAADYIDALEDEITAAILAELQAEKLPLLERMLDNSTRDEIQAWCAKEVPQLDEITSTVLVRFRREYQGS